MTSNSSGASGWRSDLRSPLAAGNVLLAPTINLLRHPGWGRAQETYSEDTHHMGTMASAFIGGAQNHVLTSPKHFAMNNLENTRFELSSESGMRALHELYLAHFKRCVVEAGAASVMSAYNKINGVYCGEHPQLLNEILRNDWGFKGFVESDWFLGARSTAPALKAGLDIEMPAPYRFADDALHEAMESGALDEVDIDRAARRSLYQKVAWQLEDNGVAGQKRPDEAVIECDEHVALAREVAEKSIVLLRNENDVLPLQRARGVSLAVVGDLAIEPNLGDRGSSMVTSTSVATPLDGIKAASGDGSVVYFNSDADLSRLSEFDVAIVLAGLTYEDEGEFIPTAQKESEGEELARGGDRDTLDLPDTQRDLIERVAAAAKISVVVLQGGSAIVVRDWVDDVDALLMAWYGGREGGHGLANVLFGDSSPSGRLPVSFPRSMDQLMPWDTSSLTVEHDLLHGYRWLDQHGHEPEYPFGYGLSYSTFEVSNSRVAKVDEGFLCHVDVENSGARPSAVVVQLYVSCQDSRVYRVEKELKGFARLELEPQASATIEFNVMDADLAFYDEGRGGWEFEACRYVFRAGQSASDLPLEAEWPDGS